MRPGGIFNTISWSPLNLVITIMSDSVMSTQIVTSYIKKIWLYKKKLGKPAKDWNILVGVGKRFLLVRVRQHHLDIIYGDYDPK